MTEFGSFDTGVQYQFYWLLNQFCPNIYGFLRMDLQYSEVNWLWIQFISCCREPLKWLTVKIYFINRELIWYKTAFAVVTVHSISFQHSFSFVWITYQSYEAAAACDRPAQPLQCISSCRPSALGPVWNHQPVQQTSGRSTVAAEYVGWRSTLGCRQNLNWKLAGGAPTLSNKSRGSGKPVQNLPNKNTDCYFSRDFKLLPHFFFYNSPFLFLCNGNHRILLACSWWFLQNTLGLSGYIKMPYNCFLFLCLGIIGFWSCLMWNNQLN